MPAVLGVDAAWTVTQPSGVALVQGEGDRWRVLAVAPSYETFVHASNGIPVDWDSDRLNGSAPSVERLLQAARNMGAKSVSVVALDIPLALSPIEHRRTSDREISRTFGGKGCAAHSPNESRPGLLGEELMRQLQAAGFTLCTAIKTEVIGMRAIEVYPHPALLKLLGRNFRVPYKVAKSTKYWKGAGLAERRCNLLRELGDIYRALAMEFGKLTFELPSTDSTGPLTRLKRFEDALDALVCAWVGKQHLIGKTTPYGDGESAIWVPN